jgi:hypothetical protein
MNQRQTIVTCRSPKQAAGWIPILEREGWFDITISINDYGQLELWGTHGAKPPVKRTSKKST